MIGPVAEESFKADTPAKYLPVILVSMKLISGAELISNKEFLVSGLAWEKRCFLDQNQNDLEKAVQKVVDNMLSELKEKYQKADVKPAFFIANI